jgi:FKBP-type peptidyl-prolyl cis-trans isomerase
MKHPHTSPLLVLASLLLALPAIGQAPPPPPAPPAAPAAPGAPGALLPPPAAPAEVPLGPFKDLKERHSYGLGNFLGGREKQNAARNPDKTTVTTADLLAGLKDGLQGAKSLDYASGLAMAAQIKRSGVDIDPAVLAEAVAEAVEGKTPKIQPADVQVIMQELQTQIQTREQAKVKAEAEKNLAAATSWLETNGKKEGVKATPSGLQYTIETPGEGRTPGPRDVVTVNLIGTGAVDGNEFDRTAEGTPGRRALMALPKGLQEGIQLMKTGGKAKFWLPPALGFGESPRGAALKPNAVLAYSIELISSEEPPANQPEAATGPDGLPMPQLKREPITAVTPPVSVEIPQGGGAPKIKVEGQPEAPKAPEAAPK